MLALTLTQPYASLVAWRCKRYETRGRYTAHRGPLAIHAGKGLDPVGGEVGLLRLCATEPFATALRAGNGSPMEIPRGAVVALTTLVAVGQVLKDGNPVIYWEPHGHAPVPVGHTRYEPLPEEPERSFGGYDVGRFIFLLDNVQPLRVPIPARGMQWFWEWTPPSAWDMESGMLLSA